MPACLSHRCPACPTDVPTLEQLFILDHYYTPISHSCEPPRQRHAAAYVASWFCPNRAAAEEY